LRPRSKLATGMPSALRRRLISTSMASGGGDRAFLRERTGVHVAPVDRVLSSMAEMHAFADEKLSSLFADTAGRALALEATFCSSTEGRCHALEVGEDAWSTTFHEGSAQAVWRTLQEAHPAGGPDIDCVPQLGISRHCGIAAIERWVAPFLELGVFKTLDLSGDEGAQPIEVFALI
jgi:hypothetical protein